MDKSQESLIDKNILKDISQKEVVELKEKLKSSIPYKEFDNHVNIVRAIDYYGQEELRKKLKLFHKKHFRANGSNKKKWLILSLITIGLMISIFLLLKTFNKKNPHQLYVEYYKPFEYNVTQRNAVQTSRFKLGVLYQKQEFKEFINQYEGNFESNEELTSDLILAIGISYSELDQYQKAIEHFDMIIKNQDFNFYETAMWYKAMSLLKEGQIGKCEEVLNELKSMPNTEYGSLCNELLNDLDKIEHH